MENKNPLPVLAVGSLNSSEKNQNPPAALLSSSAFDSSRSRFQFTPGL